MDSEFFEDFKEALRSYCLEAHRPKGQIERGIIIMQDEWLFGAKIIADKLQISERTLFRYRRRAHHPLPLTKIVGRVAIRRDILEGWMKEEAIEARNPSSAKVPLPGQKASDN